MTPNPSTRLPLGLDLGAAVLKRGSHDHHGSNAVQFQDQASRDRLLVFPVFSDFSACKPSTICEAQFFERPMWTWAEVSGSQQHRLARCVTKLCGADKLSSPSPTHISGF